MTNHVLLEIGVEELPARFIDDAEKQLKEKTVAWLQENRIEFKSVESFSTPRRLALRINDIASEQTTVTEEVRGPQLKNAQDHDGNWTKAAIGFTKGQGLSTDDIYTKEVKGVPYIFVKKEIVGKPTFEILPSLKEIIASIQFPQTMRWGSGSFRFARPIRWLVALYNNLIVPFEIANVKTGNVTHGHRFLGESVTITNPLQYEDLLEENYVIVSPEKRETFIVEQIKALEEKEGFTVKIESSLLQEVRNLVEYPTVFFGSFEKQFLQLPQETLITSMAEHQRYFPVMKKDCNELLPYFVSVRNGDDKQIENVIKGNEKVLRARLSDAVFFYDEDRKHSIPFYLDKLKTVVFQEKIGTIYEKLEHVKQLTKQISQELAIDEETSKRAHRAAEICKFDLVTHMVNEFTELQGIMGEIYALHFGEHEKVAQAVREHYMPLQASGELPKSIEGSILSVADKFDTIVGCISVGLVPTGSQDPYSLRRQAIGALRIMLERKWEISVEQIIQFSEKLYEITDKKVSDEIRRFIHDRVAYIFTEHGIERDVIDAVLQDEIGVLHFTLDKAKLLSEKRNDETFKSTQAALVRVMNLDKQEKGEVEPKLFETESEENLYKKYLEIKDTFTKQIEAYDAANALKTLQTLTDPIHQFFENNMVMAEDVQIRRNRLALVHQITNTIRKFGDLTLVEWKQHI